MPIEDRILSALRGQKIDTIKQSKPRLIKIYIASHKIGKSFFIMYFIVVHLYYLHIINYVQG